MRPLSLALAVLTVVGCGGSDSSAPSEPGPPAPPATYSIDVRFGADVPAAVAPAARDAADRWMRVIGGDLPALAPAISSRTCHPQTVASSDTIDDLRVLVVLDGIDGPGGVVAAAGPCVRRAEPPRLPVYGVVILDSADVRAMLTAGRAMDVITHEIGHVLGIGGPAWSRAAPVTENTPGDPRYAGAGAVAGARALGFPDASGVAVEPASSFGYAHWREATYGREIMTSRGQAGPNPLTVMTVGTLQDLGYVTTPAGADRTTAAALTTGLGASAPSPAWTDRVVAPAFTVDRSGRLTRLP